MDAFLGKYLLMWLLITFCSCHLKVDKELQDVLSLSGDNRRELEAVLSHYKNDTLKLKAARFLIENMVGHYAVNAEWDKELFPVYEKHVQISEKYNWSVGKEWGREIDSLKDAHKNMYKLQSSSNVIRDLHGVKADWLIDNIELAFRAWKENVYTKDFSFEFFCEYILPYRFSDRIVLDNSRNVFYERHAGMYTTLYPSVFAAVDSLLIQYEDIFFSYYYGMSIPVYSVNAVEKIKRVICEDRSWYNSLLFASVGMAVSTDFVPARGNRNNSHTWNALVLEDKAFPFDPFWLYDRWNYTDIYDNITVDPKWGKFRLPKVYRNTYAINKESLSFDSSIRRENTPPLFRNPRIKDVSHEYFDTTNVVIQLPKNKKGLPSHAFICVYGYRSWIPVQWGKVEKGQICFKGMGRDIVYAVGYFEEGDINIISEPFYLDHNGTLNFITISNDRQTIYLHAIGCFQDIDAKKEILRPHLDACIVGVSEDFSVQDTLHIIGANTDVWENVIKVRSKQEYRYIDICFPSDTVSLNEIVIYKSNEIGIPEKIPEMELITSLESLPDMGNPLMIYDNLSATGFRGYIKDKSKKIRFDLKNGYVLDTINYIPYTKSMMLSDSYYRLFYWDNKWHPVEYKKGNNGALSFDNIPTGTLYRLETEQNMDQKNMERIFLYKDGVVRWM